MSIAELEALVAEHRETLDEGHPDTLTAMLDLAELLWAEGRLLRARQPELPIILTSGYERGAEDDAIAGIVFLAKPYGQAELLAAVMRIAR